MIKEKEIKTMIKEAIIKIVNKGDLTFDEAYTVMNEIMSGEKRSGGRRHFWRQ